MPDQLLFTIRSSIFLAVSGRTDLNRRPLQPHCSALAKLGHAPFNEEHYTITLGFGKRRQNKG